VSPTWRLWKRAPAVDPFWTDERTEAFIVRCVQNALRDHARHENVRRSTDVPDTLPARGNHVPLEQIIARLPDPAERELAEDHYIHGMTVAALATARGRSGSYTHKQLVQVRGQLAHLVADTAL
jgi:DNA-directed RNA polymerase specialized sigma24 family protein